jgi:hypothetical protein
LCYGIDIQAAAHFEVIVCFSSEHQNTRRYLRSVHDLQTLELCCNFLTALFFPPAAIVFLALVSSAYDLYGLPVSEFHAEGSAATASIVLQPGASDQLLGIEKLAILVDSIGVVNMFGILHIALTSRSSNRADIGYDNHPNNRKSAIVQALY